MEITTLKIKGTDALPLLDMHRSRYRETGRYPFLIGDLEQLQRVEESAKLNERDPAAIVQASRAIQANKWVAQRRREAEEYEFSLQETLGKWPGEIWEKGSIGLHKDVLSGAIKADVFLGMTNIEEPWHLPAILNFGGWNACPEPEVHCAFHREWQGRYGALITGISGDAVECAVANPPADQKAATELAWQQYWYCSDIVEQGCGSVLRLAATLVNSPYWYFWWD